MRLMLVHQGYPPESLGGSEIYNVLGGMSAWEGERVQAR
jgi:hypothetical protein